MLDTHQVNTRVNKVNNKSIYINIIIVIYRYRILYI